MSKNESTINIVDSISILGRPVAFYPSMANAFGDISTAVIVCQFMYWKDRVGDREIYKTQAEIQKETSVKIDAQKRIFKRLQNDGFVTIVKKGLPAKNYYKFNWVKINKFLYDYDQSLINTGSKEEKHATDLIAETALTSQGDSPSLDSAKPTDLTAETALTTSENTTKTTTEIKDICSNPDSPEKHFSNFWSAGMKKVGKEKAFKSFIKAHKESKMPIDEFTQMLVDDIQKRKRSGQFGFDATHPTTYLNGKRWEDEHTENSSESKMRFNSDGLPRTFDHIDYSQGVRINEDGSDGF